MTSFPMTDTQIASVSSEAPEAWRAADPLINRREIKCSSEIPFITAAALFTVKIPARKPSLVFVCSSRH